MVKALIFDFDGLILDTETPLYETWQEIYSGHNTELPLEVWAACLGTSAEAFDPITHLQTLVGYSLEREALAMEHKSRALLRINSQPPMPGVTALLEYAQKSGLRIGLASSSPRRWIIDHLERLGLSQYFNCVLCKEDVVRVKPAPDLYLLALQRLEVDPADAIAFEDSPNGITSAQAAGIFCIGVPNQLSRFLDISHADMIIPSLAVTSSSELIANIQSKRVDLPHKSN